MTNKSKPHFIIKNKFQKRNETYKDILGRDILEDVCKKITNNREYTITFDNEGYNKGRLAILEYDNMVAYISFSEDKANGRNSSFQSFTTALVSFHMEEKINKSIYFYFLPSSGNTETAYFIFMYRLMKTAGTHFLNENNSLKKKARPFSSLLDVIKHKNLIRNKNKSNNSTYITKDSDDVTQIYGKTYGANKYETALLCFAISAIATTSIVLFEISEGSLNRLPELARNAINRLGKITIETSNLTIEKREFENNNSLRSPAYIYNLLNKLGDKKCALCACKIPQLIQGAHIWSVADIKMANLTAEEKLNHAISGENGIWLCQNHHKLFDVHLIRISENGEISIKPEINQEYKTYIESIMLSNNLSSNIKTEQFIDYLKKRNDAIL